MSREAFIKRTKHSRILGAISTSYPGWGGQGRFEVDYRGGPLLFSRRVAWKRQLMVTLPVPNGTGLCFYVLAALDNGRSNRRSMKTKHFDNVYFVP